MTQPYNRLIIILSSLSISLLSACQWRSHQSGATITFLQGTWIQDSIPFRNQSLSYTTHQVTFIKDSFYLQMDTYNKANYFPDTCSKTHFSEYAKGTYLLKNDTLLFNGVFAQPNFKQKISGCYHIGIYEGAWVLQKPYSGPIKFQNLYSHIGGILIKQRSMVAIH